VLPVGQDELDADLEAEVDDARSTCASIVFI
jgi:hypothetical protein